MGVFAGAVSGYGAYEYALKIEGGQFSYLVVGAPVVAVMAVILPAMAEYAWKQGELFKSILLWALLAPVGWLVFLAAAERVELGKANQTAETQARSMQVVRVRSDWESAKAALSEAEKDEVKAKANNKCQQQSDCREKLIKADNLREKFAGLEAKLFELESKATAESRFKAPAWLLPVALDLIAFMSVWFALSGSWVSTRPRKALVEAPATEKKPEVVTKQRRLWQLKKTAEGTEEI